MKFIILSALICVATITYSQAPKRPISCKEFLDLLKKCKIEYTVTDTLDAGLAYVFTVSPTNYRNHNIYGLLRKHNCAAMVHLEPNVCHVTIFDETATK